MGPLIMQILGPAISGATSASVSADQATVQFQAQLAQQQQAQTLQMLTLFGVLLVGGVYVARKVL